MTYLSGLGADSLPGYCSPLNPQPGCSAISGICKPMNNDVLGLFTELQEATNQLLGKRGLTLIAVDGRIGPATVAAIAKVSGQQLENCDNVARGIGTVLTALQNQVKAEGASNLPKRPFVQASPATVAGPGGKPVSPSDATIQATSMLGKISDMVGLGSMGETGKMIMIGVVG